MLLLKCVFWTCLFQAYIKNLAKLKLRIVSVHSSIWAQKIVSGFPIPL